MKKFEKKKTFHPVTEKSYATAGRSVESSALKSRNEIRGIQQGELFFGRPVILYPPRFAYSV